MLAAIVVPPLDGRPIIKMLSPAVYPVVLATVNVRSAELFTLAVTYVCVNAVVLP